MTKIPNFAVCANLCRTRTDHETTVDFLNRDGEVLYNLVAPSLFGGQLDNIQPIPISADATSYNVRGADGDKLEFDFPVWQGNLE